MSQLSLKKGMKTWGKQAETSATNERRQMHNMSAFFPRDAKSLSREERIKALRSIIFVKKKWDKMIKTRACIDGSPQWAYIPRKDPASPTASTDSLFIPGATNALEGRIEDLQKVCGARQKRKTDAIRRTLQVCVWAA